LKLICTVVEKLGVLFVIESSNGTTASVSLLSEHVLATAASLSKPGSTGAWVAFAVRPICSW